MTSNRRQYGIIAIGIVWTIYSCAIILDAAIDAISVFGKEQLLLETLNDWEDKAKNTHDFLALTYKYTPSLLLVKLSLGIMGVISSAYFIMQRNWALVTLKILSLVDILTCVAAWYYYFQFDLALRADGIEVNNGIVDRATIVFGTGIVIFIGMFLVLRSNRLSRVFNVAG